MRTPEQIQASIDGLNKAFGREVPKRLTLADVVAKIVSIEYSYLGIKGIWCALRMQNGAVATGESFVMDELGYSKELGEQAAYQKAVSKAFELEAYAWHERRFLANEAANKTRAAYAESEKIGT